MTWALRGGWKRLRRGEGKALIFLPCLIIKDDNEISNMNEIAKVKVEYLSDMQGRHINLELL